MYLISHRGNINGIQKERENDPLYINEAINKGYDVEVDVRFENNRFFLGHDKNQFEIIKDFLKNKKIWCHAKTSEALLALNNTNAHFLAPRTIIQLQAKDIFGHFQVKNY